MSHFAILNNGPANTENEASVLSQQEIRKQTKCITRRVKIALEFHKPAIYQLAVMHNTATYTKAVVTCVIIRRDLMADTACHKS